MSPDYSSISKRAKHIDIPIRLPTSGKVTDLVIDATGLKVYGEGEWKVKKHGADKRRTWRKLHLAVDPKSHDIVAAKLTLDNVGDPTVFPELMANSPDSIKTVYADGAYDTRECYDLLIKKGITACIPPRKNAISWDEVHPRSQAVNQIEQTSRKQWKQTSGYHRRSIAENAMYRVKQLLSAKLTLRHYDNQVTEIMAGLRAINKMNSLGMPVRNVRA
jgi:hypothetical protein